MKKFILIIMAVLMSISNTTQVMAENETSAESVRTAPLVVVLDPGHDSTHGGAVANGLSETTLNLKIAQYCYEELSTYNNVKVYMTRNSATCPYPGGNAGKDNSKRVEFAQSVGADVYVSLHLNSLEKTSVNGVEIFYPNKNYKPKLSTIGEGLSQSILDELVGVGLKNRGIMIRNAEVSKYADGSVADYYQVIREAKNRNITGIIVEHAYISSPHDAANFLSTDAQLKALGVADARGIAKYYGLTKGGYEKVFDASFYADKYPDLKEIYGYDEAKLLAHFIETGMSEGRQGIADFDPYAYRGRYSDLCQIYGSNLSSYYYHYMDAGQNEGRDGTPVDTAYKVTFMCEGQTVSTQTVQFGHGAAEPDADRDGMYTRYDREIFCITEDTVVQITYEPIPLPKPEPQPEPKPEIKPEIGSETQGGTETETEIETEPETESESQIAGTEVMEPTESDTEALDTTLNEPTESNLAVKEISFVWWMLPIVLIFAVGGGIAAMQKRLRETDKEDEEDIPDEEIVMYEELTEDEEIEI